MKIRVEISKYIAGIFLLCIYSYSCMSQDVLEDRDINFQSQWKFSLAGLIYDNLKLSHEGKKHLKSLPALSGELTISYYRHITNDLGVIVGAGVNIAPYYMHYNFEAPENSIFRTNDFYDYEYLDLFNMEYDGLLFVAPVSMHKLIHRSGKRSCSVEIGAKINVQNIDPDYLPYIWESGSTYVISKDNEDARAFISVMETNGGLVAVSYFAKFGWIKFLKKQRTLEYRIVANWSPKKIRTGEFEFQNLGYVSEGRIEQNINYIGFEVSYGLTTQRRLKEN